MFGIIFIKGAKMQLIDVINGLGIKNYTMLGQDIAKVDETCRGRKKGKLVLVTSISPTASGNGKTTVSIGLAQAINAAGKKAILSLREPSLGPVFGLKGGATGGGKTTIEPQDKINLHFTGDFGAITSANNLICASVDNHIYWGNKLQINPNKIYINRCLDCNDRALRNVTIGSGNAARNESFVITAASELMAIFCLATSFKDLTQRVARLVVAEDKAGMPITVQDLGITDAVCCLLTSAINPNLVLTSGGTAAFVHGGPFANIAHGASSVIATKMALSYGDYCVTEAGFGSDLGGEKFFDVVSPVLGKYPDCVVLVATIAALREHGNGDINAGIINLQAHINILSQTFGANVVVAINKFAGDTATDINAVLQFCTILQISACVCTSYTDGTAGAAQLAKLVINACKQPNMCASLQQPDDIKNNIQRVAQFVYNANSKKTEYSAKAEQAIKTLTKWGYGKLPVIIAKTQYGLDDKGTLGAPIGHVLHVGDIQPRIGAGYIVAICGKMLLLPGLPKTPNANNIKLKGTKIIGLK